MTTDPVADLLTRLMNGHRARHESVRIPYSRLKEAVCVVLREQGYIRAFEQAVVAERPHLVVTLAYGADRKPALLGVRRISKPGRRVYADADHLPRVRNGLGVAVLTTPQGLLTDEDARKRRLGGEVMFEVW